MRLVERIVRLNAQLTGREAQLDASARRCTKLASELARVEHGIDHLQDGEGEFHTPPPGTGLREFMGLKFRLEELLGHSVDLVTRQALRPDQRAAIEPDVVHVP